MNLPKFEHIVLELKNSVWYLTLNQPKVKNAMSLAMVFEITSAVSLISKSSDGYAVVFRGASGSFCAGADLKDMAKARSEPKTSDTDPLFNLNRAFGTMITAVNHLSKPCIAVTEGAALGGGFGLACVMDVTITHTECVFGLPETSLGVIPAQIAPFVVKRIGLTQARYLALTGQRFGGEQAFKIGIAQILCHSSEEIEKKLHDTLSMIKKCAPKANSCTKKLLLKVDLLPLDTLLDEAASDFSLAISGDEAVEGMKAFMEKRLPSWAN